MKDFFEWVDKDAPDHITIIVSILIGILGVFALTGVLTSVLYQPYLLVVYLGGACLYVYYAYKTRK